MKDNHKADVSHTDEFDRMYQEMVKQAEDKYKVKSEHPKTEEEIGLVDNLSSRWVNEFNLPDGYIFKDENGNVINATKIVLEKKKREVILTQEQIDTMVHESCVLFCKHCGCGVPRETCTSLGSCKDHDEYRKSMRTFFEKHKK
jgi:hypothetical protein